jgi:3-phosphoshikimate 1-carboxyvinyltransferase
MRLLAGAVAGLPLRIVLDGDASLRSRPMERVATLLRAAGADVTTTDGLAPMTVVGHSPLDAVHHRLPVASAQLLGAGALAALSAAGETRISSPGATRDHTERILEHAGVAIRRSGSVTTVYGPARPRPVSLIVPGDVSSAAPWLVAAALHRDADVTVADVGLNPTRTALVDLLRRMGAHVETTLTDASGPEAIGDIRVRGGRPLHGVTVAGAEVVALIDELPLVGILMAGADGLSSLRDAAELRVKESDRIAATVAGLTAIGAHAEERSDGWDVSRGTARSARILTLGDHRIAIAFAVAGLTGLATAVELDDPDCVAVSYPTFWDDLERAARADAA